MNDAPEWIRLDLAFIQERFATMSPTAIGCYMLLATHQLAFGTIPADPKAIERIAPGAKRHWPELAPLFTGDGTTMASPYFADARAKALERRDSYRSRGKDGALARWGTEPHADASPPRRPPDGSANGSAIPSANGLANGSAIRPAIPAAKARAMAEYEYEKREVPSSSLILAQGDGPRTTNDGSPRLLAAIQKLPPQLTQAEVDEATAILASWPDATVLTQLNRLLQQARVKDIPHMWLMGCLRRRKHGRAAAERGVANARPGVRPDGQPDASAESDRPAVAGRIDPVLASQRDAERRAAIERADVDALLNALDDRALADLHRRVVGAARTRDERERLAGLDPRRSHLLRSLLANALASGRADGAVVSAGQPAARVAHAATP